MNCIANSKCIIQAIAWQGHCMSNCIVHTVHCAIHQVANTSYNKIYCVYFLGICGALLTIQGYVTYNELHVGLCCTNFHTEKTSAIHLGILFWRKVC